MTGYFWKLICTGSSFLDFKEMIVICTRWYTTLQNNLSSIVICWSVCIFDLKPRFTLLLEAYYLTAETENKKHCFLRPSWVAFNYLWREKTNLLQYSVSLFLFWFSVYYKKSDVFILIPISYLFTPFFFWTS